MTPPIRVARVDELPPGKGKRVEVSGREVLVWNVEGRLSASANSVPRSPLRELSCAPVGVVFEVAMEDSPAEIADHDHRCGVGIEGEFIVVQIDDPAAV